MNKGKRWMKFMGVGLAGVVLLGSGSGVWKFHYYR